MATAAVVGAARPAERAVNDGLYEDMRRLLEVLYAEHRERAPAAALALYRLVSGEPVGKLIAHAVRQSAPTLPPPMSADSSPIPATLRDGGRTPKGNQ